ncbi:MAG: HEAT repeat domain-containing protein [Desulfatiglandales bacterium]
MNTKPLSGRALKQRVYEVIKSMDIDRALEELSKLPGRQVINPLFSLLYNRDQGVKWAAVTAMGAIGAELADEEREAGRVVMRRLMWNLNDESGGIGWGSPEAMGEILACHEGMAQEYAHVLISYTRENGNYLEHEMLQRGLLWGIGRLSQVRPHLAKKAVAYLIPYLESSDATVRGLATWVMGLLREESACSKLEALSDDKNRIQFYLERELIGCRVMDLAEQALNRIREKGDKP